MQPGTFCSLFGAAAMLLLGGCAHEAQLAEAPSNYGITLKTDSVLHRQAIDHKPLVDGELSFAAPAQWLDYDVQYSLKPPLPTPASGGTTTTAVTAAPVQLIGSESLRQTLRLRVPFLFDQPLRIDAEEHQGGLLTPQLASLSRSAQLQWSPAPVALGLRWTPIDALSLALPLSCQLSGSIDLPGTAALTGRDGDAVTLQGRGCQVNAPERGLQGLEVDSYSATWQWRRAKSDSSVHLLLMEPTGTSLSLAAPGGRLASGYELGASRTQTYRTLSALSTLAVRQASDPIGGQQRVDWSARATVSKQFPVASVSASVQRGADPLWFLPTTQGSGNSVELGLGLDRWVARQFALPNVGTGLILRRIDPPGGELPIDTQLMWNFTLRQ